MYKLVWQGVILLISALVTHCQQRMEYIYMYIPTLAAYHADQGQLHYSNIHVVKEQTIPVVGSVEMDSVVEVVVSVVML